jgi:succinyl-CoA synthetase beta subunit
MIEEVKGLAPLRGYRGMPEGDLTALADALVKISALAAAPQISEAEINPLIVKGAGEGVVAVDGLIVLYEK